MLSRLKTTLRRALAPVLYGAKYRHTKADWAVDRHGRPLKPGITAVVAARNEEYTIPFCLRSLIGFADEIVCIDNGSTDQTLQRIRDFAAEAPAGCVVKILERPGATLGECREAGLQETTHAWHLRWDADMVAKTTGPDTLAGLKQDLDKDPRPRTIQLPATNLMADLEHCSRLYPVINPGEPILMTFGKHIRYVEDVRFDIIRVPLYYAQVCESRRFYFHCLSQKSDDNLLHRDVYFDWRQAVNSAGSPEERESLEKGFQAFRERTDAQRYGTTNRRSIKYRYWRQVALTLQRFDTQVFGDYPDLLKKELESGRARFTVRYAEGRPRHRTDANDEEMRSYIPSAEDQAWSPEDFLRKWLSPSQLQSLGL